RLMNISNRKNHCKTSYSQFKCLLIRYIDDSTYLIFSFASLAETVMFVMNNVIPIEAETKKVNNSFFIIFPFRNYRNIIPIILSPLVYIVKNTFTFCLKVNFA